MEQKPQILIVDDEPIVLKRLKTALEKTGYEVDVCEDGQAAIERIAEQTYDVVVTDIRMGDVDGIDVLDAVRAKSPHTPTIMITGYASVEAAREAEIKGAFDYLAKPFQPKDLRKILDKALKQRRKAGQA